MLYLAVNAEETHDRIHGVHYHKGLEDGRHCGKVHKYWTRQCRPVLFTESDIKTFGSSNANKFVPYVELDEDEILALGPPVFFRSPVVQHIPPIVVTPDPSLENYLGGAPRQPRSKIRRIFGL